MGTAGLSPDLLPYESQEVEITGFLVRFDSGFYVLSSGSIHPPICGYYGVSMSPMLRVDTFLEEDIGWNTRVIATGRLRLNRDDLYDMPLILEQGKVILY